MFLLSLPEPLVDDDGDEEEEEEVFLGSTLTSEGPQQNPMAAQLAYLCTVLLPFSAQYSVLLQSMENSAVYCEFLLEKHGFLVTVL
jgi:hypothetical protein